MSKVCLIQLDGVMPNLALMKLSSWHSKRGDDITIIDLSSFKFDRTYASKIFVGGSGYDLKSELPKDIEIETPDYEKFKTDYSIGFTSRGCIRDCGFCIVKEKEGGFIDVSMDWIRHQKVIVIDNNFLASPIWKDKLKYFIDNRIKVCFTQGLDIRLINEENAKWLLKIKSYNHKFTVRAYYFAFDDPLLEDLIIKKVALMKQIGFNPSWLMFYVLCGYNTSHQEDLRRFNILKELGCKPYIMAYNNRKDDRWLNQFERYVNRKYYEFVKYEHYKNGILVNL